MVLPAPEFHKRQQTAPDELCDRLLLGHAIRALCLSEQGVVRFQAFHFCPGQRVWSPSGLISTPGCLCFKDQSSSEGTALLFHCSVRTSGGFRFLLSQHISLIHDIFSTQQ